MKTIVKIVLSFFVVVMLSSCAEVKPYQRMFLNDDDMALSERKAEKFENSFQAYREGASGAESGKIGGGCGCN